MSKVRVETFDGETRTISLSNAIKEFGKDELFEYLQGYSQTAVFFLTTNSGKNIYPIKYRHMG